MTDVLAATFAVAAAPPTVAPPTARPPWIIVTSFMLVGTLIAIARVEEGSFW